MLKTFIFLVIILVTIFTPNIEYFRNCKKCKLYYYCLLNKHLRRKCFWHKRYIN